MLKQWFWTMPLAVMVALPMHAGAQSLPPEAFESMEVNQATPLAEAASAPSFSQLSSIPESKRAATGKATASVVPLDDDREARWLPLAGLAALIFVAARNRRAYRSENTRAGQV